jgi:glycosyltransferase involved in cell wall biosynthesis
MKNLEIIIPTFNRAQYLHRTLSALKVSPFSDCKITVIDNASTDNTAEICEGFPNINYIQNPINIGAELNYCKAVEISTGLYVWVLGDDDTYCWEYGISADERMIEEILKGEVDLIMPGVTFDRIKATGKYILHDLIETERIFFALGFVPALIFKRELYAREILDYQARAWSEMGNLLPMMPFINSLMGKGASVFISETKHIDKGLRHGYSSIKAITDWAIIAKTLRYGKDMMREMFSWPACFYNIVGSIICDKGGLSLFAKLCQECYRANLFWPVAILPNWMRAIIRKIFILSQYDGDRKTTFKYEMDVITISRFMSENRKTLS